MGHSLCLGGTHLDFQKLYHHPLGETGADNGSLPVTSQSTIVVVVVVRQEVIHHSAHLPIVERVHSKTGVGYALVKRCFTLARLIHSVSVLTIAVIVLGIGLEFGRGCNTHLESRAVDSPKNIGKYLLF